MRTTALTPVDTRQPLTSAGVDIEIDVDTAICFFGTGLPSDRDALHSSWHVHTSTRALKHSLLDPRSRGVKISLILDLKTTAALSLHEFFDCLCRTLKGFPRSAISTLTSCAMRPQERFQLSRKSFNSSDLTAGAHTENTVNNSPCKPSRAVACAHLLGCAAGRQRDTHPRTTLSQSNLPSMYRAERSLP